MAFNFRNLNLFSYHCISSISFRSSFLNYSSLTRMKNTDTWICVVISNCAKNPSTSAIANFATLVSNFATMMTSMSAKTIEVGSVTFAMACVLARDAWTRISLLRWRPTIFQWEGHWAIYRNLPSLPIASLIKSFITTFRHTCGSHCSPMFSL